MAISLVGVAEGSNTNGGNVTITLPTLAENDVVVVTGGYGNPSAPSADAGVSTSGYTELSQLDASFFSASYIRGTVSWKRMGSTPDTSVTCLGGGGTFSGVAYVVHCFRGVSTSTAIDATTTTATGTSGGINSPSITTTTDGAAVLTCGVIVDNDLSTPPTGYGDEAVVVGSDTVTAQAAAAYLIKATAGSENPGSWGTGAAFWAAFTVALRPAGVGSFGDGSLSSTGTGTLSFVDGTEKVFNATGTAAATFRGVAIVPAPFSLTGSIAASWASSSLSDADGVLSAVGTGEVLFEGQIEGGGVAEISCTWTVSLEGESFNDAVLTTSWTATAMFVADIGYLSHVQEMIESKGAVTVDIG